MVESAVVLKRISLADLLRPGRQTTRAFRAVVALVDPSSESIIETVARYRLRRAGYRVETQRRIPGVGRVDLFVEDRLAVELDGRTFHSDSASFAEDRRRANASVIAGVRVLRMTYAQVVHRPEEFLGLVARALGRPND